MPERQDEFRIPYYETSEFFQDVPHNPNNIDSVQIGQARAHVAKAIESDISNETNEVVTPLKYITTAGENLDLFRTDYSETNWNLDETA